MCVMFLLRLEGEGKGREGGRQGYEVNYIFYENKVVKRCTCGTQVGGVVRTIHLNSLGRKV